MSKEDSKQTKRQIGNPSRRKLLKGLGGTSGALLAGGALPQQWTRPVVEAVFLPAHAVGTGTEIRTIAGGGGGGGSGSLIQDSFDYVVPKANADAKLLTFYECVQFSFTADENGNVTSLTLEVLQPLCGTPPTGGPYTSAAGVGMTQVGANDWEITTQPDGNEPPTGGRIYTVHIRTVNKDGTPTPGSGLKLGDVTITRQNPTSGGPRTYADFEVYEGQTCPGAPSSCID